MEVLSLDDLMKMAVLENTDDGLPEETALLLKEAEVVADGIRKEAIVEKIRGLLGKAMGKARGAMQGMFPGMSPEVQAARQQLALARVHKEQAGVEAMQRFMQQHGERVLSRRAFPRPERTPLVIGPEAGGGMNPLLGAALGAGAGLGAGALLGGRKQAPEIQITDLGQR